MTGLDRIQKRFDELSQRAANLIAGQQSRTQHHEAVKPFIRGATGRPAYTTTTHWVDQDRAVQWFTSAKSLIQRALGPDDPNYLGFAKMPLQTETQYFRSLVAVFEAVKDDFENGYLFDVRNLVHAEVFADELDLAEHYLKNDGKTASAVVAGVVLERSLRKLVSENGLSGSMLNAMNQALREANIYPQPIWRQIQAWADIRNAAAHGEPEKFDEKQVTAMIDGIRDFVAKHMS